MVQQSGCDGLPQSCPSGPETETRKSMCTCQSVNCIWGEWGKWSGECGEVNRTRNIVETQTSVQAESCDGIPTKCTQQPETNNTKLPECKWREMLEFIENKLSYWHVTRRFDIFRLVFRTSKPIKFQTTIHQFMTVNSVFDWIISAENQREDA